MMQMARVRGARVWSTTWSPPAAFKDSNSVNGGNFRGGAATNQAYASQLARYVASMKTQGINLYALSIQNEPDYNTTSYESCLWSAQMFHEFIPYLYNTLAASNVSATRIMCAEQASWRLTLATTSMSDITTSNMVNILAAHGYSSFATVQNRFGKALWETEDSKLSSAGPFDGSMTDGLYWAARIHSFLTVAEVNAWNYWWLISNNPDNEGLTDQSGNPAKRMYVLGQFSRFVRPDFYRLNATKNGTALISAYKDSASPAFAIVAINTNAASALNQTFTLTNVITTDSITPWITSDTLSLAKQPDISVSNSTFMYVLPARSVVTFVGRAVVPNSPPTLQPIADRAINAGMTLVLTNVATDPDLASQVLTFSLVNGPGGATLNASNGVFTWRPVIADAGTTNLFTVQVADNGSPALSAQQSFTVAVNPLVPPQLSGAAMSGGRFALQIGGAAGPDYAVQVSSNLFDWTTVFVTNSPPMPFSWVDTGTANWPSRFYRVGIAAPPP
jgi:O-glycosyl hydrolase